MSLTSSNLSLDGFTRGNHDVCNGCNEGHESDMDFVAKRRNRCTPLKYQSLDNLSQSSEQVRNFESLGGIQCGFQESCKKPAVMRAYLRFVRGAWRRSRMSLMSRTRTAEELELKERSALIQMSSVSALLTKDKEIMRSQKAELISTRRSVRALENECAALKERNRERAAAAQSIQEDVNRLIELLSNRKRALHAAAKNELAELERIVSKKDKKREKYSTEISVKKFKIEELKKETDSNDQTINKVRKEVDKLNAKKRHLGEKLKEAEVHFKKLEGLDEEKKDEMYLLNKNLSEVREANRKANAEVVSMQMKLLEQDAMVAELEKLFKMQSDELEYFRVSTLRCHDSSWDKVICGVWLASCVLHLVKAVDRRWP